MGKNVTIYLPDEVAQKMDQLPEVNWSEICRKAIIDYIETRTKTDLTSVISRLKNERKTDYTRGQILIYEQVAPQISLEELEHWAREIDLPEIIARSHDSDTSFGQQPRLTENEAMAMAKQSMRFILWRFRDNLKDKIESLSDLSDSYIEGAMSAVQDLHKRVRSTPI